MSEGDWIYYEEPWYNPLVGKVVIAYKEYSSDKGQRVLNLDYLCQGEVRFVEITGEWKYKEED
ncbi:hypothetical protein NVP1084O_059 [Vibrio phage 1.084.O._10N.261.49.F5]|nr:hypothetical protein NVP1084O_059 [Vibrio phage 1.084.O._10N.261.49.F5]